MLLYVIQSIALLLIVILIARLVFWVKKSKQKKSNVKMEPTLITDDTCEDSSMAAENDIGNEENAIISLTILAKARQLFLGYELLQALLSLGFRYGEMNIFHRYENRDGTGQTLFSLAQAVNPGSFDLSDVGAISCPGLILFMDAKINKNLLTTLDMMIETAKQLAEELGGDIYDDERAPLTPAGIARLRSKILKKWDVA